jgi:tRNA uridine 5-carboxymethylaminomethyl modification enzyme
MKRVEEKEKNIDATISFVKKTSVEPGEINGFLQEKGTSELKQKVKIESLVPRPQINIEGLSESIGSFKDFVKKEIHNDREALEEAGILIKYNGYISKEKEMAEKLQRFEDMKIKKDFDYSRLSALSFESREKLNSLRPETIGQASRISGVSPADISVLLVHLAR